MLMLRSDLEDIHMLGFLDTADINKLLECLEYSKMKINDTQYDSNEFKQERLKEIDDLKTKLSLLKKEISE